MSYNAQRDRLAAYHEADKARREVISRNRVRRMRGEDPLPVPEKPKRPTAPIAYDAGGTYIGRLPDDWQDGDELPAGAIVRTEPLYCA